MIIHATKKALPLFSYLTPSKDVNDASLYTILIPDVNATKKKN